MGLFAVLAGVLWLGPELLPSTAGTASPAAGCGEPTEEVRSNAYRQTPRAVTGYDLCEALDTPDLARLLGTPDEVVTGTTFASGTAPLTGERVPQPSAQVSFDTYTVDITATYNHLTVDQYVKLMHYGDETDVERLKVLDQRPAVLSSDRTMQYRIDLGGSATGGPVEQGPMARTLTVAFDRKDSGGYFDISVWSDSGLLPDDSVLVGIAEKIIPALEDRTAH
ncbi:DUF6215 domain-containing protein [Streptomyces sp. NPDC057386]